MEGPGGYSARGAGGASCGQTRLVSVVVSDAHEASRLGTRMALESGDCSVVAEVADDATAIGASIRLKPDVCLFAGTSVSRGGFAAVRMIKSRVPGTAVVLLTDPLPPSELFSALRAGIDGLLYRSMNSERLATDPVRRRGRRDGAAPQARDEPRRRVPRGLRGASAGRVVDRSLEDKLTTREAQIVELLLAGNGTSRIAFELGLNSVTVRRHISSFVRKSGASDRGAALARLRAERRVLASLNDPLVA